MVAGAAVGAASTRQKCVAQSSFEGELIAAGNLAKMLRALRGTMTFLKEPQQATPMVIDNQTVVRFCNTPQFNGRTRHIASRYWLVDLLVVEGSVKRSTDSLKISFELTDYQASVPVMYEGLLPDLFDEGQGAVAAGRLNSEGVLVASEVLAKHDENYMPPEVAEALEASAAMGKGPGQ